MLNSNILAYDGICQAFGYFCVFGGEGGWAVKVLYICSFGFSIGFSLFLYIFLFNTLEKLIAAFL